MDITREQAEEFFQVLMTDFSEKLASGATHYEPFTTTIDVNGAHSVHRWVDALTGLREWIGDRVINDISTSGFEVLSKLWEHTFGVDEYDIRDDNSGLYKPIVGLQVAAALRHKDRLAANLLTNNTALGYDGVTLFSNAHPTEGQAAQDNLLTAGGGLGAWYVFDSKQPLKMVLLQQTDALEQQAITDPKSETVFLTHKYLWGVRARYGIAPGFWQGCIRSDAAITEGTVDTAVTAVQEFYDLNGDPLGVMPDTLMCGPKNRLVAEKALKDSLIATGGTNTAQRTGLIQNIIVNPYLP
jgi:phage major head subunit gpT-like protein